VDALLARPGGVLAGVGESVQPDLGDPAAGQSTLDQLAHRGAVAGPMIERADIVMGVEGQQPPVPAEHPVAESAHRRRGQRVVATDDNKDRGPAAAGGGDGLLDAPVGGGGVGVGGIALDVAEVADAQLLEADTVIAVPGGEALQGPAQRRGSGVSPRGADRGA